MVSLEKYAEDPGYWVGKRNAAYGFGKSLSHSVGEWVGELGVVAIAGKSMAGMVTVAGTAAVSAGLVQWDHIKAKREAGDFYKEELKAKGIDDFDSFAKTNSVAAEKLRHLKAERTTGVVVSGIASMAALAFVYFAIPAIATAIGVPHLAHATSLFKPETWTSLPSLGNMFINLAAGLGIYNGLKLGMHWLGNKVFGFHKETTHDLIVKLQREREAGRAITREQVLEVFVKAHPEINHMVSAKTGLPFDQLTLADKQSVAIELGKLIPLDHFVRDINGGKINVAELAFSVENQISGVHNARMAPLKKHGRIHGMLSKISHVLTPGEKQEFLGMQLQPEVTASASARAEVSLKDDWVKSLGLTTKGSKEHVQQYLDELATATSPSKALH